MSRDAPTSTLRLLRRDPAPDAGVASANPPGPPRWPTAAARRPACCAGCSPRAGPSELPELTARDPDDPAIALLDAWATVADVVTFYQERIANEGFLRTATERALGAGAGPCDRVRAAARRRRLDPPAVRGRIRARRAAGRAGAEGTKVPQRARTGRAAADLRDQRRAARACRAQRGGAAHPRAAADRARARRSCTSTERQPGCGPATRSWWYDPTVAGSQQQDFRILRTVEALPACDEGQLGTPD